MSQYIFQIWAYNGFDKVKFSIITLNQECLPANQSTIAPI